MNSRKQHGDVSYDQTTGTVSKEVIHSIRHCWQGTKRVKLYTILMESPISPLGLPSHIFGGQ